MLALALGVWPPVRAAEPLVVFAPERAPLPIYVAADAAPAELAAAAELARVTGLLAGRPAATVATEPAEPSSAGGVLVGRTRAAAKNAPPLRVAADWFAPREGEDAPDTIRLSAAAGRLYVEAATPEATEFAVAWLLQRHAGVRWIWPGTDGEIAPRRERWELPGDLRETRAPAFVSRDLFVGGSPDDAVWAKRHGLRARVEFSHALNRVFTAREADAHPEWFAEVRGQRLRPRSAEDYHWQPNLARPDVAAFAAERARAAFAAEPARRSFSLGMNDTVRFDQGPETRALVEPLRWFRGMPDYSPLVFTFMNRAAAALDAANVPGDRYLGCLAYFWCENPPPFPVHPRVVPFVTTDRSQFFDPAYRAAEIELLGRWGKSGVRTFGIWDYAYGGGFVVPRQPLHALADGIRAAHRAGARAYFADAGEAEWGFDAFKLWLIARLLWEPERSVEELADEFFPAAYGPAAPRMREFFFRCERRWMAQGGPAYWLKFYQHEDQAALFPTNECQALASLLGHAIGAAPGDAAIHARIRRTERLFAVTESLARYADGKRIAAVLPTEAFAGDAMAVGGFAFSTHVGRNELAEKARFAGLRTSLAPFVRDDAVPGSLLALGAVDPAAPARALANFGRAKPLPREWRQLAAWIAGGGAARPGNRSVLRNGSFAATARGQDPAFLFPGGGELPADWEWRAVAAKHQRARLDDARGDSPARVLRIEGAWDTQVFQWNAAGAGKLYVARTRARGAASLGSDAGLFLSFLDAGGKPVGDHRVRTLPRETAPSADWRTLVLADVAPADAAWVGVGLAASRQTGADWFEAREVELIETEVASAAAGN